jgi:hypothetical protein
VLAHPIVVVVAAAAAVVVVVVVVVVVHRCRFHGSSTPLEGRWPRGQEGRDLVSREYPRGRSQSEQQW